MSIKTRDSLLSYAACYGITTPRDVPFLGASSSRQALAPRSREAAAL